MPNIMTDQAKEEIAKLKTRLQARKKKAPDPTEVRELRNTLEQDQRDNEKKNALRTRLEQLRNKAPEPVKEKGYGPTGIFPMVFIGRCAKLYRDKLIAFVEQWDDVAHDDLDWLESDG